MSTRRGNLGAAQSGGKVYAIGGSTPNLLIPIFPTAQKSVEVYDAIADTWTTVASMNEKRTYLAATAMDSKVYAAGGGLSEPEYTATVEVYDTATGKCTGDHLFEAGS